jgi:hypothetical protein
MRILISSTLLCLLAGSHLTAAAASRTEAAPAEQSAFVAASAAWLTHQFNRPISPAQILAAPEASLEGCIITRLRPAITGATALSLRCPGQSLSQLLLLDLSPDAAKTSTASCRSASGLQPPSFGDCGATAQRDAHHPSVSRKSAATLPPIIRAGASLQADWRTPSLHAELPVVALDSGPIGAEIRVRVAHSDRVFRAHILTANSVTIIEAGA